MQTRHATTGEWERAMKTRLRGLASGWRARANKTHEGPPGVPPVRGVKIESRTVRRARLAMVLAVTVAVGLAAQLLLGRIS